VGAAGSEGVCGVWCGVGGGEERQNRARGEITNVILPKKTPSSGGGAVRRGSDELVCEALHCFP